MTDREERGKAVDDALAERFESDNRSNEDKTSKTSQTPKTSQTEKTDVTESESEGNTSSSSSLKSQRASVMMYLPEELREDLDLRFDELNLAYRREHGEKLQKNRDYYPAVVKAGLTGTDVEDILEIDDE